MIIKSLGDSDFAADYRNTIEDEKLGDELSAVIGDTFVDSTELSPQTQWTEIVKILRVHGLEIVEKGRLQEIEWIAQESEDSFNLRINLDHYAKKYKLSTE